MASSAIRCTVRVSEDSRVFRDLVVTVNSRDLLNQVDFPSAVPSPRGGATSYPGGISVQQFKPERFYDLANFVHVDIDAQHPCDLGHAQHDCVTICLWLAGNHHTLLQFATWNATRTEGFWAWVVVALGLSGPLLASTFFWATRRVAVRSKLPVARLRPAPP